MANNQDYPAIYIPIPNTNQEVAPEGSDFHANKVKISVYHDKGAWTGIKVRFVLVEKYPNSILESQRIDLSGKIYSFRALPLQRFNAKKLDKVGEIIKANADKLASWWLTGFYPQIASEVVRLTEGV